MWTISLNWVLFLSYLWFHATQNTQIYLRMIEPQKGISAWFSQNRMVRFWKPEYPVSAVLTLTGAKLTPSLSFSPNSQEHPVESLLDPLVENFLIPPWNPSILNWFQLSKDRRLQFPLRFHLFQGILIPPFDLLAPWMDLKCLKYIAL